MKKKLLFAILLVAMLSCLLAISVSAETALKPQASNAYGELSFFDESITVGRTDNTNGFTPFMTDGTSYARVVIGDGTTFYTFPTYYILSKNGGERSGKPLFQYDFSSINKAMEIATSTNPGWSRSNVYRIEVPANMTSFNGGGQNFSGFDKVIEIYLQPNSTTIDNPNCLFHTCRRLEVIHNIETFIFKPKTIVAAFQYCESLTTLTLGVNTDITETGNSLFNGCKKLESVNLLEAFPNLNVISQDTFRDCYKLKSITTSGIDYVLELPEGITSIGNGAFYECDSLKYISLPSTLKSFGTTVFHGCGGLEFVDFNNNTNTISVAGWGVFYKCAALKAISLPANMIDIKERMFNSCSSLQAVCLPANLQKMQSNGYGQGTFDNNSQMYFVKDSFDVSVCIENGVYDSTRFTMPSKPSIYYMPESFTIFYGHVIAGGLGSEVGTFFNKCTSINETIVFGTSFVNINSCNEFANMGTKSSPKNLVFLGNISSCVNFQNTQYTSFIFVNIADKGPLDLGYVKTYKNSGNAESYMYFCSTGAKYDFRTTNEGTSGDALAANIATIASSGTNEAKHVFKESLATEADCENPRMVSDRCFCGAIIGAPVTEGVALGHNYTGAVSYVFDSLITDGKQCTVCVNGCGIDEEKTLGAVYTVLGYSVKTFGTSYSFVSGYDVNTDSLALYEETKGVSLEFGFAFNAASTFTEGDVTLDSFKIVAPVAGKAGDTVFSFYQYQMSYADDTNLDADIVIAAYVIEKNEDGEALTFINRADGTVNGFNPISYNKALELAK